MRQHVTVIGALHIGFGLLGLLVALIVFTAIVGGGLLSGDAEAITITSIVGSAIAFFLILVSAPGVIVGIGLLRLHAWARIAAMILAVFNLVNFPLGTAVAVYTIWILMQDETAQLFASDSRW
jgi:hypothetical protein